MIRDEEKRSANAVKLGERLRALRRERNLRQKELADRAGVNRSYLSLIENGKSSPTVDILGKLARALGVKITSLMQDDGDRAASTALDEQAPGGAMAVEEKHFTYDTDVEFDIYPGLKQFLEDEDEMTLAQPNEEEVALLKSIRFRGGFKPDKRFYREALLSYRRSRKSNS